MKTLRDYGERAIIADIVSRYCRVVGDDCSTFDLGAIDLVVTTDPVPEPAAKLIGGDSDPYWAGWLLVVINASDLAAAAATPRGFVAAIDAPAETSVANFERFLAGLKTLANPRNFKTPGGILEKVTNLWLWVPLSALVRAVKHLGERARQREMPL